jgi:hypothetical protein
VAATFQWCEDNGVASGSPAKGSSRTIGITQGHWKSIDSATAAYTTNPITAGQNSFTKFNFGYFTGVFNQIGNGLWAHTAGSLGFGLSVRGVVSSLYATPTTAVYSPLTVDMSLPVAVNLGQLVRFSLSGPESATPAGSINGPGYTQYLVTQLQTALTAEAGDITPLTFSLRYDEN